MTTAAYAQSLFEDCHRVEVRHQNKGMWSTTWCDTIDALRAAWRDRQNSGNLFTSIHHPSFPTDAPISNDSVDRWTRIFIDIDPTRPKGTSSTESELETARTRARAVRDYLRAHGWPPPAVGVSGNGCHMYYRAMMPVNPETIEIMRVIYDGLARRFTDSLARFDRSVHNPGRISVLFGSVKRKGLNTKERPHRRSWIKTPRYWKQVSTSILEKLASLYRRKDEEKPIEPTKLIRVAHGNRGDFATLDSLGWFSAHGSPIKRIQDDIYGVRCPWHNEHSTPSPKTMSDSVIITRQGRWDIFSCRHDHCADRRMIDVVNLWGDADAFCSRPYERNHE